MLLFSIYHSKIVCIYLIRNRSQRISILHVNINANYQKKKTLRLSISFFTNKKAKLQRFYGISLKYSVSLITK